MACRKSGAKQKAIKRGIALKPESWMEVKT
jgi:hypothetical protein